jgi:hypothetical protein
VLSVMFSSPECAANHVFSHISCCHYVCFAECAVTHVFPT